MNIYLNKHAIQKLNNVFLNENIFNLKYYKKETKQEFENVYKIFMDYAKKEIIEANHLFFNSPKLKKEREAFKYINENMIKPNLGFELKSPIIIVDSTLNPNLEKEKKFITKFIYHNIDYFFKKHFSSPHTVSIILKKNNLNAPFFIVFAPESNIIKKFFQPFYKWFARFYEHNLIIKLLQKLVLFHECVEVNEGMKVLAKKSQENGLIYIRTKTGKEYLVGNHYNLVVLAKEAVLLNKFYKKYKILQDFRNYRALYEWKVIKEKTGVDLSKLNNYNEEIFNKLRKIKTDSDGKLIGKVEIIKLKSNIIKAKRNQIINKKIKE